MTDKLTKGLWAGTCIACFAASTSPALSSALILVSLAVGAAAGLWRYGAEEAKAGGTARAVGLGRGAGAGLAGLVAVGLLAAVYVHIAAPHALVPLCYLIGCLVFGGGPVVIPLLLLQLVAAEILEPHQFLVGLGVVQMLPGPMFNLAAFVGGLTGGLQGAATAWAAMMVPGILLSLAALPFWVEARDNSTVKRALKGVNACAAGLMGSAVLLLWQTVVTTRVRVCVVIALAAAGEVFDSPAYALVLGGLAIGVASWAAEMPL